MRDTADAFDDYVPGRDLLDVTPPSRILGSGPEFARLSAYAAAERLVDVVRPRGIVTLTRVNDLDLALRNRPEQGDGAQWANGIELVYRKLLNILENEGVMGMDVQGQFFDPNLHEAISSEPSDEFESGQIIAVVKQGYMLGDRVLRPALVRVAQ